MTESEGVDRSKHLLSYKAWADDCRARYEPDQRCHLAAVYNDPNVGPKIMTPTRILNELVLLAQLAPAFNVLVSSIYNDTDNVAFVALSGLGADLTAFCEHLTNMKTVTRAR